MLNANFETSSNTMTDPTNQDKSVTTKANARALKATRDHEVFHDFVDSPIGPLLVAVENDALAFLLLPKLGKPAHVPADWQRAPNRLRDVRAQLDDYFAGKRNGFDLQLAPRGTAFQCAVWDALLQIPYGATTSYADIARRVERPTATRAVGAANGANPISIIVPCHRVIGANGSLTGYGGGLPTKTWLLGHERKYAGVPTLELR